MGGKTIPNLTPLITLIPYRVFKRMLKRGHPPDDWLNLLVEAKRVGERPIKNNADGMKEVLGKAGGIRLAWLVEK